MKNTLWKFTDTKGSFISDNANSINTLYLPLCNNHPMMSCVTPDLHGDLKSGNNSFLLEPVSRINLALSKASRNFWFYLNPGKVWSATGVSKDRSQINKDTFRLEAGLLWQKITRSNKSIGLQTEITTFVPSTGEPIEIMKVVVTNISTKKISFTPTAAIPLYCRSANNIRDHRHVTSLLIRTRLTPNGIVVKPTLTFDENGHTKNRTSYFVYGIDKNNKGPVALFPTHEEFCGNAGDLLEPAAVYQNLAPDKKFPYQGKEPMGALRFSKHTLAPGKTTSYIIYLGIASEEKDITATFNRLNSAEKVTRAFEATCAFWLDKANDIAIHSHDSDYNNWFKWVSIQPLVRKIYGCSYLPDFDYGRGGRGWRDLWQDCLSLILNDPCDVRNVLVNNYGGIRIDGSNATIIGQRPGEFIADRNNISRVWMDHGVWPLITTLVYIHQTGDIKILLERAPYFKDRQLSRSQEIDENWTPEKGNLLRTDEGKPYRGTILEHILVENLVQFFNVGSHNHTALEGADWNDGLDMATHNGESVAFTALYASNLYSVCQLIEKLGQQKITVFKELGILLDTLSRNPLDYDAGTQKETVLEKYFESAQENFTGETIAIPAHKLLSDLQKKAARIADHIRKTEWLAEGFFNGYYDDRRQRVEGKINGSIRMTLPGQTFPIMAGIATPDQIIETFKNAKTFLQDTTLKGFRLNTDFKTEQLNLGRAFSFVYGEKENGSFFSHMCVMFAYALYSKGFAREGFEVFNALYRMALNTQHSAIYPSLPEYFNGQGRGMYSYLTGSASWYILTTLTQIFGIRGEYGDLVIEPKLNAEQFGANTITAIQCTFAGKRITVSYLNPNHKKYPDYMIRSVRINSKQIAGNLAMRRFVISRQEFLQAANTSVNTIEILLD